MATDESRADEALWRAAEMVGGAERIEGIEELIKSNPLLISQDFLSVFDQRIDDNERTGRGDWWRMTRGHVLLSGCREGTLKDALFRCWPGGRMLVGSGQGTT